MLRWPAWALGAGLLAAAGTVATALIRYPGVLDDPKAGGWLAVLVTVFILYAAATAIALVRPGSPDRVPGLAFGLTAGGLWLGEIWTQAPARLPAHVAGPVAAGCAIAAALTTIGAGAWLGPRAGLWTGLSSGVIMTVGMIAIQAANLDLLGARADYQRELAASGGNDMPTYLIGDAIAASLSHMLINPALGLLGGAVASLISRLSRRRPHGVPGSAARSTAADPGAS